LIGKTRDRAGDFGQSALLIMLNLEVREEVSYVVRLYPFGRIVVKFIFNFTTLKIFALPWHLLFHKLINLCLQVIFFINYFLVNLRRFSM